jgi:hypothetical protein
MNNDMIQITGLTPVSDYPHCQGNHSCKEICETDKLCIPCRKPNIKDIIEVFICITITSFKVICTPEGKKLIINGLKHIKLIYTAEKSCDKVHCAHLDIPFCDFILLNPSCKKVVCIKTAIEHISVYQISCRDFSVSSIILLCPIFKKHYSYMNPNEPCDESSSYDECNSPDDCSSYDDCNSHDDCSSYDDYNCHEYRPNHKNCNTASNNHHYNNHSNYNKNHGFDTDFHFSTSNSSFYYCDESYPTQDANKH